MAEAGPGLPWGSAIDEGWRAALEGGRADGRLVAESAEREQEAVAVPFPAGLAPELVAALRETGIESLYAHQLATLRAAQAANVIVTSGTASGKSLAFNLPVLDALARDEHARALYIYPTKALAQDQARKLSELSPPGLRYSIYDGDTPKEERRGARRRANLVLTNPDMLHVGILPHHKSWGDFLVNLRYVVLDEAHVYRGVFGSNVANVLRRLRRISRIYRGADGEPRFILTSATIANPAELAERLVGTPFELVDDDAAPRAGRRIAIWNPPLSDEAVGVRRSALSEAAEMLAELVICGVRTICFLRSRKGIELIQRFTALRLGERGHPELAGRIAPYRAGYTPNQRREVEARLASGELLAVVATDALELGIDIGELDAAICVTFPGTVASLRQMWGRAGRRTEGLAVYMAGEDSLDQFFCRHPTEFLTRPVEAAILDHTNERIQSAHLLAAAYEAPLGGPHDAETLGAGWRARAEALVEGGLMRVGASGRFGVRGPGFPASWTGLRSASVDSVTVLDLPSGELLGTVEAERAFSTVHPGAVYLHMGRAFEVQELDLELRRAVVTPFDGDYSPQARKETDIYPARAGEVRTALGVELSFGLIGVTEQVVAFQRKRLGDHQALDFVALDLPEQSFRTQALWYVLGDELAGAEVLGAEVQLGALHAAEHCQIAVLPLLAMCDRWDIGGLSTNVHQQTAKPTIFIYDGYPGGVGISRRGYEEFERLVADAARLVGECRCESGCPSCVQSPKCGNLNEHLHKAGAIELMGAMLARSGQPDRR